MSDYIRNRRSQENGAGGSDGFFCRFTFGQFFALLVMEVFTIFFVFYLGARYGRELLGMDGAALRADAGDEISEVGQELQKPKVLTTSDPEAQQIARELIKEAKTPELKERIKQMIDGASGGRNLQAEKPVVIEKRISDQPQMEPEPSQDLPQGVGGAPAQQPFAEEVGTGQPAQQPGSISSSDLAQTNDSSVIRVKSGSNARYSVQIGSYPSMQEGTQIVERWKGKGYPAYMMIADIPDRGRWYRVRLGGFENREDAARYLKELQTRENVEALVVLNEQ